MSTTELETEAMEYALGLMDPDERRAFQADLLDDPELADAVWEAEALLAPMAASLAERKPSARVQKGIDERLFAQADAAAAPGRRKRSMPTRTGLAAWRSSANFFFTTTVAACAVIAVLLARPDLLFGPPPVEVVERVVEVEVPAPAQAQLVAGLQAGADRIVLVRVTGDNEITATAWPTEETGDYELWVIPPTGDPLSLGILPQAGQRTNTIPPAVAELLADGATIAVTLEPVGGSPTGEPSGDAVVTGTLTEI